MSVWETLGIDKTDDERAIKRAYAKQLKIIRPDEDAQHFQKLREARDEALYLAQFDFDWDENENYGDEYYEDEYEDDETPTPTPTPNSTETESATDIELTDQIDLHARKQDNLEIIRHQSHTPENSFDEKPKDEKITEHTSSAFEGQEPFKDGPATNQIITDKDLEPETESRLTDDQFQSTMEKQVPDQAVVESFTPEELDQFQQAPQNKNFQDIDLEDITYLDVDAELERLMGPWDQWNQTEWITFINKVRECSFDISNHAEYEILAALAENVAEGPALTNLEFYARNRVLEYLNEEYGWTQNDRRIYDILLENHAESLLDHLRNQGSEYETSETEVYYDALGFPKLTEQHFRDFLGRNGTVYETYYRHCKEQGHALQKSWSWPGFLFSSLWLTKRCNDGIEALTGIGYILCFILLYHGVSQQSLTAVIISIGAMALMHIAIGLYGKRMVISAMASTLTELASEHDMSEEKKLKKMKSIGNGGLKALYDLIAGMFGIGLIAAVIYNIIF